MLTAVKGPSRQITKVYRVDKGLYLVSEYANIRLMAVNNKTIRVTFTREDKFSESERPGVVVKDFSNDWIHSEDAENITFITEETKIIINKKTGSFTYCDYDGKVLLKEKEKESKVLLSFDTYRLSGEEQKTERIETPDGIKEIIREACKEYAGKSYHSTHYLNFGDEAIYGFGQHEEGYGSLRGRKLYCHQANRKSAVPMFVSTKGYGILTDTYSSFIFDDSVCEPYIYCEAVPELDYYFMNGSNPQGVIDQYRIVTGKASMLPKWAFGYIQSKERYETQEEILDTVNKSRRLGLGMDCIVLDWLSWEDGMWGQKTFDRKRFPSPDVMTQKLHEMNTHFMISLWPTMDRKCDNRREFDEISQILPCCDVYNAYAPEARKLYWDQLSREHWAMGVDSWWCDSSEPLTPEWSHIERPEASSNYAAFNNEMSLRVPAEYADAFCLYHALGIYEGQRQQMQQARDKNPDYREKRVTNLTRSGTTGQQRLGTIMWSGDIDASWDTLRKQLGCGLNFSASGLPYWTFDIGAFFVKEGNLWYWKGEYEDPANNNGYKELYTRWFQLGAFMPMFRAHGTDVDREMWVFGNDGDIFYDAMVKANKLRYRLMPYIYSEAGKVWLENKSMISFLGLSLAEDKKVWDITDQFMFGQSLMVCPVTSPMYYDNEGRKLETAKTTQSIYLPKGCGWFDFESKEFFEGGQTIEVELSMDKIPVFVKEGSIIPMAEEALSTAEQKGLVNYNVFARESCEYIMYNDDGDGYGYERGEYSLTKVVYDSKKDCVFTEVI